MLRLMFVMVLSVFMFFAETMAATYYVDYTYGRDSNSGTSSSSPWKTISKVNSKTFRAGDNILFKRGSTWKEILYVKQNGTSSSPITYGAYGSGNAPVIDGSSSRYYGIYMDGRYYIVIQDLRIQNATSSAIRMKRSKNVTIKNNQIHVTGRAGVFIEESANCQITKNKITTPSAYINQQTDGIYGQRNANITYNANSIIISNKYESQHCDAMQFYLENNATISNNYIEQNNTKTGRAQGIYCSENSGTFKIYNNVGYGMYTSSSLLKFKNSNTSGKVEMIGNTVYGGKAGLVQTNDPYIIFKNNIIVTTGGNAVVNFEKSLSSKSNVSYNLYKRSGSGGNLIIYKGYAYTLSKWKTAGYDTYSIEADPKFSSISSKNFSLLSGSPALNKGINMSSPYNVDYLGTPRPYGSRSDIGAYEMKLSKVSNTLEGEIAAAEQTTPDQFELTQNFPNPFNPSTTIKFSIPENALVILKVYDITGSEVKTLVNDFKEAGYHQVSFNASELASGTYIYMIKAKDFVQTRKMILLK